MSQNDRWCPEICPITGRKFFMWIYCEDEKRDVPTYGGPFESRTIPKLEDVKKVKGEKDLHNHELTSRVFDHDLGHWTEYETQDIRVIDDQVLIDLEEKSGESK